MTAIEKTENRIVSPPPVDAKADVEQQVRVIQRQDQAALVEWFDGKDYHRVTIPQAQVKSGLIKQSVLDKGVPHGLPWERLFNITATPKDMAKKLRQRGVFTVRDIDLNPTALHKAVIEALAEDIAAFIQKAREAQEKLEEGEEE